MSTPDGRRRFGPIGLRQLSPRADLIAGLTVWAVLVPEALAYATIAGVAPVVGLYAAVPALILYALLGSSRHLIVGPMAATAALSAGIIGPIAAADPGRYTHLTIVLAITTGVVAIVAGLLRFGFLAAFISEPVLKGFIIGLALTIIAGQLPKLLGIGEGEGNTPQQLWHLLTHLGSASITTVSTGLAALAVVLGLRRWLPAVPGSLAAVVLGVTAVWLGHLDQHGVDIVGPITAGLPAFGLPTGTSPQDYLRLAGPAVGVMLIGFAEGLGAAKTYAAKAGYHVDANRELIGLGAANLGSGLSSGMVVNGSLSKTAVNGTSGARSQMSGLVTAALTLITLLFLTGLFESLPEAVLAAIVIAAVIELVDIPALRRLYAVFTARLGSIYGRAARNDFLAALAAMLGVIVFGTLPGLAIGIGLSVALLIYRTAHPHIAVLGRKGDSWVDTQSHPDAATLPGIVVARVESGLYFANADTVSDQLRQLAHERSAAALILDGRTTPSIDVTAASALANLSADLRRTGCRLILARDIGQVRDVLRHTERELTTYPTLDDALAAAHAPTRHATAENPPTSPPPPAEPPPRQ